MAVTTRELRHELEELIEALDSRVPHMERLGEATIAREAAALRARAIVRLTQLARDPAAASSAPCGEEA